MRINHGKELRSAIIGALVTLTIIAWMLTSVGLIIAGFEDVVIWRIALGAVGVSCFSVFWIYMRSTYWK